METQAPKKELRRHRRFYSAFPVVFQEIKPDGKVQTPAFQGFTRDVAKGGMSIDCKVRGGSDFIALSPGKTRLKLSISIPRDAIPVAAIAVVKWATHLIEQGHDIYFFGVEYEDINNAQQKMIEAHVMRAQTKPKVFIYFLILFVVFVIVFSAYIFLAQHTLR